MFGLFGNSNTSIPVKEEMRVWMDKAMLWLIEVFGKEKILNRTIVTPHYDHFAVQYDGKKESATATLNIVATQMEIDPNDIMLHLYAEGQSEVDTGGALGNRIYMQQIKGESYSGGKYWGRHEDNKFHVGLNESKLKEPEEMIATLAHELAHIKLLGENRIEKNNEPLTDLTTVVFGLGIFNANAAFKLKNGIGYRGWSKLGYLSQMEWGYALALLAHVRGEDKPGWIKFLSPNIKADFKQSMKFICSNPGLIGVPPQ